MEKEKIKNRKRQCLRLALGLLFLAALGGCGKKEENPVSGGYENRAEYYDITSEKETIFTGQGRREENTFLGMQYHEGEPIQLWLLWEEGVRRLCMLRADGQQEYLPEIPANSGALKWYMDNSGNFYCWKRGEVMALEGEETVCIRKLSRTGDEIFSTTLDPGVRLRNLYQMADGAILLLLEDGGMKLEKMDPETGVCTRIPETRRGWSSSESYITAGSEGALVLDIGGSEGILEVDTEDGAVSTRMSFVGTSHSFKADAQEMDIQDFRITEEGKLEVLWVDPENGRGIRETLQLDKIEKIPVVLRTTLLYDGGWLQEKVMNFNQKNETYHVVLECSGTENQEEIGQLTAIQMAGGGGPDILYGYALEYVDALVEKGGFENLAPYMEADGISEEDYYPFAFSCWRDDEKIYTFRMRGTPYFSCIAESVLGSREEPDMERLLDALLEWEEEAQFGYSVLSASILEMYLECSEEDFWGMVDWEEGTCNFENALFSKMLQVAKRYGLTRSRYMAGDENEYPLIKRSVECSLYGFKTSDELEEMGMVREKNFEDGSFPTVGGVDNTFAVNAASANKQGAWEFIRYIMSKEVQRTLSNEGKTNKAAYQAWFQAEMQRLEQIEGARGGGGSTKYILSDGREIKEEHKSYAREDITEERLEEYFQALENTRELTTVASIRMRPILRIIQEEAEAYFEGVKSLEETIDVINNRANLYVEEQR